MVMLRAIWYNLYNLKNVKNTHGEMLLSLKLQASTLGVFHFFKTVRMVTNRVKPVIWLYFIKLLNINLDITIDSGIDPPPRNQYFLKMHT